MNTLTPIQPIRSRVPQTMGFTGCVNCKIFSQCGGHHEPIRFATGCASYTEGRPAKDTDDMNPNFPDRFWQLWDDVGGLVDYTVGQLRSMNAAGLPRYVPQLQGRHLHAPRPLDVEVVALRLFQIVVQQPGGGYGLKYRTAEELRAAYGLAPNTRVILVAVDHDTPLEQFWKNHEMHKTCEALAKLGLEVTVPNYSFFTCVPRFQILRNRKRILLAAEHLSKAGVGVAIHLNAITPADWAFWLSFLREHTEVTTVTLEFQTGPLENRIVGQKAFDDLDELIDRLGRPIHLLLVGAGRFYQQARERRWNFTVIDSKPFMFAQNRRVIAKNSSGGYALKFIPTQRGASVYQFFEQNLRVYEKALEVGNDPLRDIPTEDPNQTALLW
jgi:hypothetical protein